MTDALARLAYAGAARLAGALAAIVPSDSSSKLARSLAARLGVVDRIEAWARSHRDPARPLLWMHAPSVGEGLQARPVLERLRARRPELQLFYTHFSPSAERFAAGLGVDGREYLPFDVAADIRRTLDALRPTALVFAKLDLWPELVRQASLRGVRLGLISGTVSPGSGRRRGIVAGLLRGTFAALDCAGAIDAGDAERLVELGVRPEVLDVTGDTRYDQVWERARGTDAAHPSVAPFVSSRPTLVAGSTWPADDASLLPAWLGIRARVPGARLIIAPHEPTTSHLAPIEDWARRHSLSIARYSAEAGPDADVVIVDRVGVLGDLYVLARVAYVGGGFHGAGLHSVLEPAAYGAPVIFGPRHRESRDARLLLEAGGAEAAAGPDDIVRLATPWFTDAASHARAGDAASGVVQRGLGAADRSLALVSRLLDSPGGRAPILP